jgi:hypothetical protein
VVLGPQPDLVAAAAQDRDVERVDGRLEQHISLAGGEASRVRGGGLEQEVGRIGFENQALEGPVAAALDLRRDVGQGRDRAEGTAAAGELEAGDVVLDAFVVAGEGRGAKKVHGPVRTDQAAAGQRGRGGDEQCGSCRE